MQYTIGDVLSIIGFIVGLLVSIWASLVGFALVFPNKSENAKNHLQTAPWVSLILGAALLVLGGVFAVVLLNLHNPLTTLMGWSLVLYLLAIMVVGGSGLALVMGERMQQMDRRCPPFRGLARSAGIMVLASLVPIFGWVLSIIVWMAALGAGFQAIFVRSRSVAPTAVLLQPQPAHADPPEFTL